MSILPIKYYLKHLLCKIINEENQQELIYYGIKVKILQLKKSAKNKKIKKQKKQE